MKQIFLRINILCIPLLFAGRGFCFATEGGRAEVKGSSQVVPLPVSHTFYEGEFLLTDKTRIECDAPDITEYLSIRLSELGEFPAGAGNTINIEINDSNNLPAEGYILNIFSDKIDIQAKERGGAVYAIETLMQLIPAEEYVYSDRSRLAVQCQRVEDYPRYSYRGAHLDVARTFSEKKTVMRFIDNMARHKFNRFHWHLTDDEGWRIEIKSFPELTSVGGYRGGDSPVPARYALLERKYGGYFTQDEIREVIEYAAFRNIEVIPEIDLPGHSLAATKSIPGIICPDSDDVEIWKRNVWCATREENYAILDTILTEIAGLFPSEYIHVGGDEVPPEVWSGCPSCSAKITEHSAEWLNGYFLTRLNEILARHGKKQAVWNEAVGGGNLAGENIRVHGWENVEACRRSVAAGYETVVMPAQYFYLDMKQTPDGPGFKWAGIVTLEKVYSFDPDSVAADPGQLKNIVGVESAFWTELYLQHGYDYLDYQTYPRMCAVAEMAWSPQDKRHWSEFRKRLTESHYPRLRRYAIKFRDETNSSKYGN